MPELIFFINKVVIAGTIIGSIYALGAIGITLVFSILRFAHFAHADMMTLGALISLVLLSGAQAVGISTPLPTGFIVMPLAMILTACAAVLIDRFCYRPFRERNTKPVIFLMASIGVALMLQGLIRLFSGTQARNFFADERKEIFNIKFLDLRRGITFTEPQLLLVIFTLLAVIALHLFLTRSRLGKAMRAMSDNADLARVSGIDTQQVVTATWVIAGMLAAAAGTLLSMDVFLKPDLSFNILLPIFAAAIVGGIGHPYGAIAGGFVVGFAETLAVFNWAVLLRPFKESLPFDLPGSIAFVPTEYKIVVPFFILVLILVVRPTGLFKGRVL